jgi:hypothetical protein
MDSSYAYSWKASGTMLHLPLFWNHACQALEGSANWKTLWARGAETAEIDHASTYHLLREMARAMLGFYNISQGPTLS